jgi:hypothetical protein
MQHHLGSFLNPNGVPPLGSGGDTYGGDKSVSISPTTNISVSGVSDPGEASRMIASHQNRVTQDLTRNGLGAIS